jgi:hypothetical protein
VVPNIDITNIDVLNAVTLSLRLVRNPSEKERFPTGGNDKLVTVLFKNFIPRNAVAGVGHLA